MARIGIPGRSIGPGSDDWIAAEFERRRKWEREFSAAMPTMVRGIVSDLSSTVATLATVVSDLPLPVVVSNSKTTSVSMPTGSVASILTTNVAIPSGYTRADVTIVSVISATNNLAFPAEVIAKVLVNGAGSAIYGDGDTASGGVASPVRVYSGALTGLSPGSISIEVQAFVGSSWGSSVGNKVYTSGMIIFRK